MTINAFVVDDEPLARATLRTMLEEMPDVAWIGEAADGHNALAALDALPPALVFLDIRMPGLDGM